MFDFNINWDAIANFNTNFDPVAFEKELAALASVATVAAVNSPAVVDAPKNTAPSAPAVQEVVSQVVQAVAPVVAPNVPPAIITKLEQIIPEQVVSNPQVKASDTGVAVTPAVVSNIASSISSTFKNDAQKDAELNAAIQQVATQPATPAATTTVTTPKPEPVPATTPIVDEKTKADVLANQQPALGSTGPTVPTGPTGPASLTGTTGTPTVTYSGRGISNDPLMADGKAFTGNRNGIEYKDGVAVDATRADILQADREAAYAQNATDRAATNPLYNFQVRPEAPAADAQNIYYYSWIGGTTSGEWKLYKAPNTPENQAAYGPRSAGGTTAATGGSAVGANQVVGPTPEGYTFTAGPTGPSKVFGANIQGSTGVMGSTGTTGATGSASSTGVSGSTGTTTGTAVSYTASDGTKFTDQAAFVNYQKLLDSKKSAGQSAYSLLLSEFNNYGLGSLIEPLKDFITEGLSPAEFTLRLRETDAYKKRFAANAQRTKSGLRALSEAEYINLEDQYQNVMRNYGLPSSYYTKGDGGVQQGFEKFIAGDVSAAELEDRIQTAQNRVVNAAPEVSKALREFYPDITNGDILAYALDPEQALSNIKRKVTAAEIGAGAMQAGLATGLSRAEELQKYGVTGEAARQGYQAIAETLPTASKLGDIYAKQGLGPYTQTTAEQETFGLAGAANAAAKRRKLAQLETAQFSGTSGAAGGALGRERAGQF